MHLQLSSYETFSTLSTKMFCCLFTQNTFSIAGNTKWGQWWRLGSLCRCWSIISLIWGISSKAIFRILLAITTSFKIVSRIWEQALSIDFTNPSSIYTRCKLVLLDTVSTKIYYIIFMIRNFSYNEDIKYVSNKHVLCQGRWYTRTGDVP